MNWHKFKRGFFVLSIIFLFFMNFLNVGNFILNSKFLLKDSSVFCQDKLNFLSQDFTTGIIPNPSVSYNRTNASNYANYYCDKYCHDGYYYLTSGALNTNSTTCSKQIDSDYEPGADCAHFVSCCIGDHQGSCSNADNKHPGGGLKLGKDHPENNAYGRSSCLNLATDLLNKGYAVSVSPVDELEKGDVIIYNYSNNKTFYEKDKNHHAVFYTGNSKVHAHSNHTEPNNPLDWWENEYEPLNANTALFIKIGYKYTSDCWVRIPPLVTPYVNVRNKAGGSLIGEAEGGAIGKVVGGPISATLKGENYFWYKINFESGATVSSGWVASMYLRSIDNPHLFNVNDKIKAKYPVKSRKGPGKKEQNIANISSNTIGTVLEIATYSDLKYSYDDGYTWVKVKWDNGYEGWSAQNYLEKTSSCTLLTVTTKPATDITSTSAKLNAVVNPNGQETEVLFFYGTDRSNLNNHTSFQPIGKGNSDVNVSEVITGLKPNTTYYFKAYAECPSGGVDGEIKSFKTLEEQTPPDNKPQPPKNLTATAGDGYVELSWNAVSSGNLQGYRIYRGTSSGKESFYDAVPQTRTSYKNTNVNNGTTYYYYVTALDKNGNESEPSNRVSATPNKSGGGNPPSDDKVKLTLYVHEGSSNGPTVSGASISGYDAKNNYFSKTTNNSGYAEIEGVAGNWSFKVTKSGYKENKWNQSITSTCTKHAYIEKDSGSGGGNEKPQPPKNLKAEVVFDSSTRKAGIRITWDAPSSSSVTKYRMYRKEESGSYSSIGDRDSAYTTFRDWSITLGNKYYYKVTSINNSGESDYSNEANVIAGVLVNTNAKLNVRKGAGLSYDVIVTLPKGTYGLALGGPTKADGYYWWYCYWNYNNNNYFGWSIEDGLDFYKGPLSIKEPIDVVTCFACNNFRFPILYLEYL